LGRTFYPALKDGVKTVKIALSFRAGGKRMKIIGL